VADAADDAEVDYSDHFIHSVYEMLARFGVDPHEGRSGFTNEAGDARIALAVPGSKVGLSIDGDRPDPLLEDGWHVPHFSVQQLETFALVYRQLGTLAFEHIRRESMESQVKTGSQEEERLLAAILKANLPTPDRNFRIARPNGTELTVPDFVWAELKVAFFMDGLWWHVGRDDDRTLKMIADAATDKERGELLMKNNRSRAERDGDNRSELASMGWIILSCTDKDLATGQGVRKQVTRIGKTLQQQRKLYDQLNKFEPENPDSGSPDDRDKKLMDLFS